MWLRLSEKIFAGEESCVPNEAEDRHTEEAFPPIRRRNCASAECAGAGRTFAVSADIAVSVPTVWATEWVTNVGDVVGIDRLCSGKGHEVGD